MKRYLLATLAMLITGTALAATSNLAATRPTGYTNGQPLPATDIAGYEWSCSFTPTAGTAAACAGFSGGSVTGSNPNTTATFTSTAAGGRACFQVVAKAVNGVSSDKTAITPASCVDVPPWVPNAPGNVTITITVALELHSDSPITLAVADPVVTRSQP